MNFENELFAFPKNETLLIQSPLDKLPTFNVYSENTLTSKSEIEHVMKYL